METDNLTLVEPCEALLGELADFFAEYGADFRQLDGLGWVPDVELDKMVQRLQDRSRGIGLPEGYVPASTYWLVRDETTILGALSLRHRLNENLRQIGGHIGYSIRPSQRGKGRATRMLAMGLDRARARKLDRVLLTCNKTNRASARVIEKNGGVLEAERLIVHKGTPRICRYYWIEL